MRLVQERERQRREQRKFGFDESAFGSFLKPPSPPSPLLLLLLPSSPAWLSAVSFLYSLESS